MAHLPCLCHGLDPNIHQHSGPVGAEAEIVAAAEDARGVDLACLD